MSDRCRQEMVGSPYPIRICNGRPIDRCFECDHAPGLDCEKTGERISFPASGPIDSWCPLPRADREEGKGVRLLSWGAKVTNNKGEEVSCQAQCANHTGCNIDKVKWPLTQVLSSVDRCAQGINDYGVMELRCNGFQQKPAENAAAASGGP